MATGSSTPNPLLRLDNQVCFALHSASLAMAKVYRPLLAPLGLTYPQYLVMLVLWEQEGLTVTEIGERLHSDSGTLTPLLKRLQTQGLLSRERDAADERRVLITLTPIGRRLKAKAQDIPACVVSASGTSVKNLQALGQQVRELRDRLQGR